MVHKILSAIVFLSILSQLIFTTAHNVVIANITSVLIILPAAVAIYLKGFQFNFFLKYSLGLLIYWLLSIIWHKEISTIEIYDYSTPFFIWFFLFLLLQCFFIVGAKPFELALQAMVLINLALFLELVPVSFFNSTDLTRFSGTFQNANLAAILFYVAFLISILKLQREKTITPFSVIIIFVSAMLILTTGSKKGLLILILTTLLLCTKFRLSPSFLKKAGVLGVIFLFCGFTLASDNNLTSSTFGQYLDHSFYRFEVFWDTMMNDDSRSEDGSTSERLYFISEGIREGANEPILGHGFEAFEKTYGAYSHSNYIELFYNGGILALVIYYIPIIYILIQTLIAKQSNFFLSFGIISLLLLDIAMVSYTEKYIQYVVLLFYFYSKRDIHQLEESQYLQKKLSFH